MKKFFYSPKLYGFLSVTFALIAILFVLMFYVALGWTFDEGDKIDANFWIISGIIAIGLPIIAALIPIGFYKILMKVSSR